jgi:hypothetical protein
MAGREGPVGGDDGALTSGIARGAPVNHAVDMKRLLATGLLFAGGMAVLLADDAKFSQQVAPGDFAAAGLSKLSPDELATLDRLVQRYKSASAAAQAAAEARARQAEADAKEARAAQAAAEKKEQGFLAKTKALLLPAGTAVEYQPIESRIVGTIAGWDGHTVFTLENGQRWRVENNDNYYGDTVTNPKVRIVPASFNGYKLLIDGFPGVRVRLVQQ